MGESREDPEEVELALRVAATALDSDRPLKLTEIDLVLGLA